MSKQVNTPKEEKKATIQAPKEFDYEIEIEGKKCWLKKPNKAVYKKVLPFITPYDGKEPDIVTAGEIILKECTVKCDKEFLSDDEFIVSASMQCVSLIQFKEATLKKN